jgi:hypothetical protein
MKPIAAFTISIYGLPLFLAALTMTGCASTVDDHPVPLPPTCSVQPEDIRIQLCPRHPVLVLCSDTLQTNFAPGHCDGPDWTDGQQIDGNAWCCDADQNETHTK